MFEIEYLSLRKFYSLSYANEYSLYHPSVENFYRLPTVFDTTYIFSDKDWQIFGKKFLSLFNKTENDFIYKDDFIIIELHDVDILNRMVKQCKSYKINKDKVTVILKFKIVPHEEFISFLPEDTVRCSRIVSIKEDKRKGGK